MRNVMESPLLFATAYMGKDEIIRVNLLCHETHSHLKYSAAYLKITFFLLPFTKFYNQREWIQICLSYATGAHSFPWRLRITNLSPKKEMKLENKKITELLQRKTKCQCRAPQFIDEAVYFAEGDTMVNSTPSLRFSCEGCRKSYDETDTYGEVEFYHSPLYFKFKDFR